LGKGQSSEEKCHKFIGMNTHFEDNQKRGILMKEYLLNCIEVFKAFGDKISTVVYTTAKNNCFEINDDTEPLSSDKSDSFHHIVSNLIYVSKCARLNTDPSISFLCKSVRRGRIGNTRSRRLRVGIRITRRRHNNLITLSRIIYRNIVLSNNLMNDMS